MSDGFEFEPHDKRLIEGWLDDEFDKYIKRIRLDDCESVKRKETLKNQVNIFIKFLEMDVGDLKQSVDEGDLVGKEILDRFSINLASRFDTLFYIPVTYSKQSNFVEILSYCFSISGAKSDEAPNIQKYARVGVEATRSEEDPYKMNALFESEKKSAGGRFWAKKGKKKN